MAKRAANTLSVPAEVEAIWSRVKDRAARQLFHADPERRLAAVAAFEQKHRGESGVPTLLLAAAVGEPVSTVRAAMLARVAVRAFDATWGAYMRLRASAPVFAADPDPAVRAALARCFEAMPAPLVDDDLAWIAALLDAPGWETDDDYGVVASVLAHQLGARDDDFAPLVTAYRALASDDARVSRAAAETLGPAARMTTSAAG